MPITESQNKVLKAIAANRNPQNYLAGATVFQRAEDSPRYSDDLDFFHDVENAVAQSAETDAKILCDAGYQLDWLLRTPVFYRAIVTLGGEKITVEWAQDSAFRFFPVQKDALCGYRLHEADAAINKMLALAGRQEARDFVDILHLDDTYLSLGAMAWAACGKDPGYTPAFILEHIARHTAYSQDDIDRLNLKSRLDIHEMKKAWIEALEEAQRLVDALPSEEIGCLYLGQNSIPVTPDPGNKAFDKLVRHYGCVSGAWPQIVE